MRDVDWETNYKGGGNNQILSMGSATVRLGVRDFKINCISCGFRISDWISVFHADFWISGFQSGFQDFKVDFWISKRISTFKVDSGFCLVTLKILLMNNDIFLAQMHTEYNVIGTS